MTDIEELVRESLRTAPAVVPSSSDPVAAVSHRVRRARALWGGGVAAVAAVVVAAVVVPLSLRDSAAGRLVPTTPSATASPAPSSDARGVTVWQTSGAVSVVAGGGWLWELDDSGHVVKVDPHSYEQVQKWDVHSGSNKLAYGGGVVWVWTTSTDLDTVLLGGVVQAVDLQSDAPAAEYRVTADALDFLTVLDQPSGRGDALIVTGKSVRQLRASGGSITVVSTTALPSSDSGAVVATGPGDYWVNSAGSLLELRLSAGPDGSQTIGAEPKDSVSYGGALLSRAGSTAIWTYDGRLVALTPSLLHQGESVAQGERISLPAGWWPVAVAPDGVGGLFVSIGVTQMVPVGGEHPGLYHVSRAMLEAGEGVTTATPSLPDVSPDQLAPDGQGGVDFAADGVAEHWTG